ncbi:taste receptor type 2 member 40-like [Hyla sarda]|uniref:taste receptor type 2 member 40-like n=1 Tax=Hyla sarda TaxID=327740 RepID=UPI0024C42ED8|nr:taste receptor type 2 member 40-like [Hyla sarda]
MGLDHIYIPPFVGTFLIILMIEIFTGVLTNVFIVVVNVHVWLRGQSLNSSDHLVVSLALSNFCFSCINASTIVCFIYFYDIFLVDYVFYILYMIMTYSIFSSSWLSAWLCLFFCVKIITYQQGCMAWLKAKITSVVPWLILSSQVFSIASSLPVIWSFTKVYASNSTDQLETNGTSTVVGYKINQTYNLFSIFINCFVPFMVVMATTGRIIASLFSHARHMKQNMEDHGPSLKAHQGAARTMMSLLILYLIFYVVELGLGFLSMMDPLYWVCFLLIFSFPTLQSVIFIAGNAKLKQTWLKILKSCIKK